MNVKEIKEGGMIRTGLEKGRGRQKLFIIISKIKLTENPHYTLLGKL